MKLLLHTCCAPCTIYPLRILRKENMEVMGYFHRENIHPYTECEKREKALADYALAVGIKMIYQEGYEIERFLQNIAFRESDRCYYCYSSRLKATAIIAKKGKFDAFSTTLLYSKFQKHEIIKSIGDATGKATRIPFYYQDFRTGWKEGVEESKRLNIYRQQYCGCIYSEKERYYKA